MHIKAIQIKEQLLGHEDYEVALSVGHLASLYNYDMNQYEDAERLYLRSIAIGQTGGGVRGLLSVFVYCLSLLVIIYHISPVMGNDRICRNNKDMGYPGDSSPTSFDRPLVVAYRIGQIGYGWGLCRCPNETPTSAWCWQSITNTLVHITRRTARGSKVWPNADWCVPFTCQKNQLCFFGKRLAVQVRHTGWGKCWNIFLWKNNLNMRRRAGFAREGLVTDYGSGGPCISDLGLQ